MTSDYGQPPESFLGTSSGRGQRLFKILGEIVISITGLVLVALACVIIRLANGPIDLNFLNSDVQAALNSSEIGVSGSIQGTQLAWHGWSHPLEIQVKELQLFTHKGDEILNVPEVGISLNLFKLVSGEIVVKKIRIYSPRIILRRDEKGEFALGVTKDDHQAEISLVDLLKFLSIDPDNKALGKLNDLHKISILKAQLDVIDQDGKQNLSFPRLDLILNRRHTGFDANFKIYSSEKSGKVDLLITHKQGEDRADAHLICSHVSLSHLFECALEDLKTTLDHHIHFLSRLEAPLSGEAHFAFNPKTAEIIEGKTDLTIHHGALESILEGDFSLGMKSGQIAIEVSPTQIILKNLGLYTGDTLLNIQGSLTSSQGALTLSRIPTAAQLSLQASLKDLPLKDLSQYWPAFAATDAREWIVDHMTSAGVVGEGSLDVEGAFTEAGYQSRKFQGKLSLQDGAIEYLNGLPLAEGIEGSATFTDDGFDINLVQGHVGEAQLTQGHIKITGLSNDQEAIDINLKLQSSLPEVLRIIDHAPLMYAQKAGLDPTCTKGNVKGTLHFDFPLLADLKFDDVKINIEGIATQAALKTEIGKSKFPIDLQNGKLMVHVTEKNMNIEGPATINNIPAKLKWVENFEENQKQPFQTQLLAQLEATADDLKRHGYDYTAFVNGPTPFLLTYTKTSEANAALNFNFNLTPSQISIPHIGWQKKEGEAARLQFSIDLESGDLKRLNNVHLTSGYLQAAGTADFDKEGDWQDLNLTHIQFPKTNASLFISRPETGGYFLKARGKEINAAPFMTYLDEGEKQKREEITPLVMDADLEAIHMGEGKSFKQIKANVDLLLTQDDTVWNSVQLTAAAGKGTIDKGQMKDIEGGIWMEISKPQDGDQTLLVRANDAGEFFRNLNLFDDLEGGELAIKATRKVGNPFAGVFKIQNFDVNKIPLLARFAAVASPVGIVNLFSDGTISFHRFDTDFVFGDDVIQVKNGRGKSISLGFTVEGNINRTQHQLDLKGVVIPMYVLSSILDNIPLIGSLLNGSDGKGLFAANYTIQGSTEDPQVDVNTLSGLVPGFIRGLFSD